jgi:hypothetical protein
MEGSGSGLGRGAAAEVGEIEVQLLESTVDDED